MARKLSPCLSRTSPSAEFQARSLPITRHDSIFPRFPFTFPRYGHDTRHATYTSPPMISLHRGPRVMSRYTPRSRTTVTFRVRPARENFPKSRHVGRARNDHWHSRTCTNVSGLRTPNRFTRTASGSRVPPRSRERPIRPRGTVIDVAALLTVRPSVNTSDTAAGAVANRAASSRARY